ncbi:uncharacterized protein TNIN_74651 [Trichonephila inaurata madagascariensis]|uniref:Uncharacterized protein n=1 Tax=Trichonephila inaurata madagascariensis TaxID=2747483 RepID=A0A8X7C751_9ARAC|nr:uncharacterized protein TNIN_74651 [Trichonephila inaurata madagascariensis]
MKILFLYLTVLIIFAYLANDRGRASRPETWEYRGQYFYGYRPKPNSGRRRAARLLAAGLPLLLAPLLSIIFSFPVVIPVAQMTAVTTGASLPGTLGAPLFGRRRKRRNVEPPPYSLERKARLKELEVVSDYLHQIKPAKISPTWHNSKNCLLGHMLNNEFIPKPFKKRLKAAATHGRRNTGQCNKFFCNYVDNNWDFTSTYPHSQAKSSAELSNGPQKISSHPSLQG